MKRISKLVAAALLCCLLLALATAASALTQTPQVTMAVGDRKVLSATDARGLDVTEYSWSANNWNNNWLRIVSGQNAYSCTFEALQETYSDNDVITVTCHYTYNDGGFTKTGFQEIDVMIVDEYMSTYVTLSSSEITLENGYGHLLEYSYESSDSPLFLWETSNPRVATVEEYQKYGLVRSVGPGTATIKLSLYTDQGAGPVYYAGATCTVTVQNTLRINAQPENVNVTEGETATFTIDASGDGVTYQWMYRAASANEWQNVDFAPSQASALSLTAVEAYNGFEFCCEVADQNGQTLRSEPAKLTVYPVLGIVTQPADCTVLEGDYASFTVKAKGYGLAYQWQYRKTANANWNTVYFGGNTSTYGITNPQQTENGYQYRCKITDGFGKTIYTDVATLYVNPRPVFQIVNHPADVTAAPEETVSFTVEATGINLTYQWQVRAAENADWEIAEFEGSQNATLTLKANLAYNGYQFRCEVFENGMESTYSNAATLTVQRVLRIIRQPSAATVRKGTAARFAVEADGDNLTYQWQYRAPSSKTWKNFTSSSSKTANFRLTAKVSQNGYKVRCQITDQYGERVNSRAVALKVKDVPALRITKEPANATVLKGKYANFTVEAVGGSVAYQWQYRTSNDGEWKNFTSASATTKTLKLKTKAVHNGYQLRCALTDEFGDTAETKAVKLKVKSVIIDKQPKGVTVQKGKSATFKVEASGAKLTYRWQYRAPGSDEWKNFSSASSKTKTLKLKAKANQNGYKIRCMITAGDGEVAYSKAVALKVK